MPDERRTARRGTIASHSNVLYRALRALLRRAGNLVGALGIFLVAGLAVAVAGIAAFAALASHMQSGKTQAFDNAVIAWMGNHHTPALDTFMLEITALGTGTVVLMTVAIAALFLGLTAHRYSAILLIASAGGGLILNNVLKLGFNRPRPTVFLPGVHTVSSSFPSGHAMSAAIVYTTVAYLAARLLRRPWARFIVMVAALVMVVLISISRLYLGVHYPSDVIAGVAVGLAWAGFCMATLEAIQKFAIRPDPRGGDGKADRPPAAERLSSNR